jgi:hypothetical protein
MTVTSEQAQMLTSLAVAIRPHGAPRWDAPGVMAAVKKVAHLDLADVTRAVTRAAEDRDARTPAVIASLTSHHWRDRDRAAPPAREPFNGSTFCGTCGEPRDRCERKWAGDHVFESVAHSKARKGTVDISPVVVEVKGHIQPVPSGALHEPEDT